MTQTTRLYSCALFVLLIPLVTSTTSLPINTTRLLHHLHTLAHRHNDLTPPSAQRIHLTPSELSARTYLKSTFESHNLTVSEDAVGNIFAVWPGSTDDKPIMTGSHFDAIPHSGMYDGVLGIFAALEAIRALREAHVTLRRSVGVVAFTSEEPTRFGISCLGSRVMSAALTGAAADACVDKDGISVLQARTAAGYTGDASSARLARGAWASFVELHIEQADILEKTGVDIGAVTAIAAPASMQVVFDGDGGHAGALLMKYRNDALVAAAELITFVEQVAKGASEDSVATVGRVEVFPNAINSVPRRVTMGVDVRDIDEARRNRMVSCIRSKAEAIASRRRVKASFEITNADDPAKCDDRIVKTVVDVAKAAGLSVKTMVSRAYHDALFVARFAKTGMIFVPCRGGVSHAPEEYVEEEDVENGVRVLAGVLRELGEEVVGATEEKEEL